MKAAGAEFYRWELRIAILNRMALTAGSRLGNYEVLAPIGVGGIEEVYRARDTKLGS